MFYHALILLGAYPVGEEHAWQREHYKNKSLALELLNPAHLLLDKKSPLRSKPQNSAEYVHFSLIFLEHLPVLHHESIPRIR